MLYGILLSFRLQIYLLNSVACLYLSFLKEQTWFLYLNLKVVSQRPMYVSLEVVVVTSTSWYTVLALSKQCRSDDTSESRWLMESGMFFRIDGG